MRRAYAAVVLLVLASGCAADRDQEQVHVESSGRACLFADSTHWQFGGYQSFKPDSVVHVIYMMDTQCLSYDCSLARSARCAVSTNGTEIHVEASADWTEVHEGVCTDDCGGIGAECGATEPLAAGTYTFTFGSAPPLTLEVPSQVMAENLDTLCLASP